VSRENLRGKPLSIGIAGGAGKVAAIRAALKGKWCNVLVTDEKTASAIVNEKARAGRYRDAPRLGGLHAGPGVKCRA
jgi:hypothetical protein